MFASPRLSPAVIEVYVREDDGSWRLIFTPHSDADWMRWQFDHNRVRKLLGRVASSPHNPAFVELARWIARQVARDFPSRHEARVSLVHWDSLPPEGVRAGDEPKRTLVRDPHYDLEKLRADAAGASLKEPAP
jgi:hypothetical protein